MERYSQYWDQPINKNNSGEFVPKPETELSTEENRLGNSNSTALNSISNEVDVNQFKLILNCETKKKSMGNAPDGR